MTEEELAKISMECKALAKEDELARITNGARATDRLKKALDETAWYANAAATAMMLLSAQVVAMVEAVEKFAKLAQAVADEVREGR